MSKLGTAKYGSEFKKKEIRKIKDGEQVYRILPPVGKLADDGKWSVFYSVHWGYKNTKGQARPFVSPYEKNRKTGMVEVPDAARERLDKLKAAYDKAKAEGNVAVIQELAPLVGPNKALYSLDNNHHVNAIDQNGNLVVLKIRHNAKKALDKRIEALRKEDIDPLSVDNGRWFVISRSGTGLDTTFSVDVLQEKIPVPGIGDVKKDVVHVIDAALEKVILRDAADLSTLYKVVTPEQVARIVATTDLKTGKSTAVDEIFDTKNTAAPAAEESYDDSQYDDEDSAPPAQATTTANVGVAPTFAPTVAPAQPPPQTIASATAAGPMAQTAPAPVATPAPAQPGTAKAIAEMSNDDFLSVLGIK